MLGTFHLGGNRRAQCGFLFGSIWLLLLHPDCGRVVGENADITGDNGKEQLRIRYTSFFEVNDIVIPTADISRIGDDCQVTPVIHVLQYPGCVPKPIPSFACVGRCASYIQVRLVCIIMGL